MPRPKTKTKSEDLARVRNNQRRSRARRRKYVQDLEQKIKELEEAESSNKLALNNEIRLIRSENFVLKQWLRTLGLQQNTLNTSTTNIGFLNEYGHYQQDLPFIASSTISSPPHQSFTPQPSLIYCSWTGGSGPQDVLGRDLDTIIVDTPLTDTQTWPYPTSLNILSPFDLSSHTESPSFAEIMQLLDPANDNTTLCSVAYRLVYQCNKRGLREAELQIRMQTGFQTGTMPNEGCRVDNKVLLAVLAEISLP